MTNTGSLLIAPDDCQPSMEPRWAARLPDGRYTEAWFRTPRLAFMAGWDEIQKTRAGDHPGIDPWLWVLGLERVDRDGRPRPPVRGWE